MSESNPVVPEIDWDQQVMLCAARLLIPWGNGVLANAYKNEVTRASMDLRGLNPLDVARRLSAIPSAWQQRVRRELQGLMQRNPELELRRIRAMAHFDVNPLLSDLEEFYRELQLIMSPKIIQTKPDLVSGQAEPAEEREEQMAA